MKQSNVIHINVRLFEKAVKERRFKKVQDYIDLAHHLRLSQEEASSVWFRYNPIAS
jgi:dimeric dUTPase (all-alpha-NTP-PPase superfamily)